MILFSRFAKKSLPMYPSSQIGNENRKDDRQFSILDRSIPERHAFFVHERWCALAVLARAHAAHGVGAEQAHEEVAEPGGGRVGPRHFWALFFSGGCVRW